LEKVEGGGWREEFGMRDTGCGMRGTGDGTTKGAKQ